MIKPFLTYAGSTREFTKGWKFVCSCTHYHNPPTTILPVNTVQCPKCQRVFLVDYNAAKVVKELEQ